MAGSLPALTAARLVLSFAVLIVPSALMGATLPLVVKSSLLRGTGMGGKVGVLYATNTAGAIGGSLLAGLALIPQLGLSASFGIAVGINLLVAFVAVTIGRRWTAGAEAVAATPLVPPAVSPWSGDWRMRTVLIVFAANGNHQASTVEYALSLPRDGEVDLRGVKGDVQRHIVP